MGFGEKHIEYTGPARAGDQMYQLASAPAHDCHRYGQVTLAHKHASASPSESHMRLLFTLYTPELSVSFDAKSNQLQHADMYHNTGSWDRTVKFWSTNTLGPVATGILV